MELLWNFFQKTHFLRDRAKKVVKQIFSLNSEAEIVLNLSLIFKQISAWRPYKLGPYKKKCMSCKIAGCRGVFCGMSVRQSFLSRVLGLASWALCQACRVQGQAFRPLHLATRPFAKPLNSLYRPLRFKIQIPPF